MLKKVTLIIAVFSLAFLTACTLDKGDIPMPNDPFEARKITHELQAANTVQNIERSDCSERGTVIINRETEECPIFIVSQEGQLLSPTRMSDLPEGLRDGMEITMRYRVDPWGSSDLICQGAAPVRFFCISIIEEGDKPSDDSKE